jgi:CubicO group peptidase (beta-lactamase class C family)
MSKGLSVRRLLDLSMAIWLALSMLPLSVGSARPQDDGVAPDQDASIASPHPPGPTDPAEVGIFLDDLLRKQMEEKHIAGAAVSIVKDGKLFFAKGYGYADLANKLPVDPEQTIFRIGSVGKVFTWTAVMQLVEQGKLDLNADINTYLDFRIPDTFPQPITLKHLLTHTSGLDDRLFGSVAPSANDLVPVREWLISHMPVRSRPPGDCAAYSNYNAMLAGYIVARVSGQPYEEYIQQHIFNPLGMAHSTARSPVPPDLRAHLSVGYTYKDGALQAFPAYEAQPALVPSGGQLASVTDMARFMIAHLQYGRYSDANIPEARILEEATARQMQTTLYTPDPRLLGTAYGFFDFSDNGQHTLGYVGYSPPMHSLLLLLPDQNLGVFITYNSDGGDTLVNQHMGFQRAFFDHYFPAPAVSPLQPSEEALPQVSRFVGSYRSAQGSHSTAEKVGGLFGGLEIKDAGDGALLLSTPWGQWRFIEVEPLYFRRLDGQFAMVFREDGQGRITKMFTDLTPQFAWEKLNWYETPGFHMALLLSCALTFLSMLIVAAIIAIRNRLQRGDPKHTPRGARLAQETILAVCILNLLFMVGSVLWASPISVLHPVPPMFRAVLGLGVVSAVLTVGALVFAVLAWKDGYWSIIRRLYYAVVTLAAVAFVWALNYWNLLGWRY